jgi:hypothetical protein
MSIFIVLSISIVCIVILVLILQSVRTVKKRPVCDDSSALIFNPGAMAHFSGRRRKNRGNVHVIRRIRPFKK